MKEMKTMKKLVAILLAAVMVMSLCGVAFADDTNFMNPKDDPNKLVRDPETTIQVTNLDSDSDTAIAIQLLQWVGSEVGTSEDNKGGWKLTTAGEKLVGANGLGTTKAAVLDALLDGISADEASKIATALKNESGTPMTVASKTATATGVSAGMYYVKVTAAESDTIYNPMIVSADYYTGNNDVDASENIGTSSVAKKSKVTFDKQAGHGETPEYTYNDVAPGDAIPFKITAKIPAYGSAYSDPIFQVKDTFSAGLKLLVDGNHPFTVKYGEEVATATVANVVTITDATNDSKTFTVDFEDAYLLNDARGITDVTITYWGVVTDEAVNKNVNPMDNTADLTYSNSPDTTKDVHDKTRHYDFSFDGELLGQTGTFTSELVKIGVQNDGTTAYSETVTYHNEALSPLNGATFTLTAVTGKIGTGMAKTYTTTGDGHIKFNGLDAGVYKLEETSAPAGFVKDNTTYYVEIVPTYDANNKDILKSYKVLFGTSSAAGSGSQIASFSMTNENTGYSEVVNKSTDANGHQSIKNTQGLELPSTGGIGTTIFYISGIVLVLGAAAILVARRKADAE